VVAVPADQQLAVIGSGAPALLAALVALAGGGEPVAAAAPRAATVVAQAARGEAPAPVPVYRPPTRGAPAGRVGGGTRGLPGRVAVAVLAPDHVGLTTREQPTLHWFLTPDATAPVEITVVDPARSQPLLALTLPPPVRAGIHGVRLADHGVRLSPGIQYQWSVAVVLDPDRRSRDVVASGAVERVEPPEPVRARAGQATAAELPFVYADAGLWYDAVTALSERVEAAPGDETPRRQRAALLEQVGLREAAAFDLRSR
jgi:hypothetical protein